MSKLQSALRWLAIANPAAGKPGAAPRVAEALRREGLVAAVAVTRAAGEATRLAREAGEAFDGMVSVGGDGTNHEVVAGLDRARHALALMPLGHGNCLARDLGVGRVASARLALAGARETSAPRAVDLLEVTLRDDRGATIRRLGTSTFAIGHVAAVVATGRGRLAGLGRAAYAVASMMTRPARLRARLWIEDLEVDTDGFTGIVLNNTAHLANFRALPAARLDDGRLDLLGLGGGWLHQLAHNASVLSGIPLAGPRLERQATRARFECAGPTTVMLDGELVPGIVAGECGVRPAALRCVGAP